jgi:hypothetical protein
VKKVYFAFVGVLSILLSTIVGISPASAFVFPNEMQTVTFTVDDVVSLDMGCQENNITDVHFFSGSLPPGLSMDSQGMVTGTPTTPGDYRLDGYSCTYNGGSNSSSWPIYYVVFRINAITTPTPVLAVHNLNTENCSFYTSIAFPVVPDENTTFIRVTNQAGTEYLETSPIGATTGQFELTENAVAIENLNTWPLEQGFNGSLTGSTPFACGDTIEVTVGYQWRGAPVATKTVSGVVVDKPAEAPKAGSAPIQKLINLNNADCQFRILATLPTTPLPGSTKITINSYHDNGPADQLTFTISDQVAAGVLDFTFDPTQLSSGPIGVAGIASEDYQVSTSWECGSPLNVSVEYRDLLNNYWSSTSAPQLQTDGFSVTPTKPETVTPPNSDYSITASQASVGTCSISVIASLPDEARPIALAITNLENNDWITAVILYDAVSNNGVISANLSFSSKDDISASFTLTEDNKVFEEETECEGTYRAVLDSPGGILASTLFTLGKPMPTCNAGSTLDQEERSCTPVERGYYTTELNSSTPIACPAGMTTATTASKSVNDCYKPIVQSIVGFKAPKALKFNGTTNLALITNTKAVSAFTVTGPCTAKLANVVTKVKGKKVTTKMLKVTAGKKAGTCSINLTSPTTGKYLELSKAVKIKVSKTGK